MDGKAVDWITDRTLEVLARDGRVPPQALTMLLRQYALTGRADVGDALGPALAREMDDAEHGVPANMDDGWSADLQADRLLLFVDAAGLSDDERLPTMVSDLVAGIQRSWPGSGRLSPVMRCLDACLTSAQLVGMDRHLAAAIDELERVIGLVYVPGGGLARAIGERTREPGRLLDYAAAASALLSAYRVVGRLPYPMLAEELMQFARREWWDLERGGFWHMNAESEASSQRFVANCQAARVLCRLAVLHGDPGYRQVAVIAQQSDYSEDAQRTLDALAAEYRQVGLEAAVYGLAVSELQALREPDNRGGFGNSV